MGFLFKKQSNATTPQQLNAISVDRSRYGDPVPLVYGMQRIPLTLLWYGAFTVTPQTSSGSGKGGGGTVTGYNYTASCVMGLCEGPIQAVYTVWKDKAITTIANENLSGPFLGAGGQAIWTYLSSNFPTQAVPYDHTAYVGAENLNLGSSASVPNYTFEVQGFLSSAASYDVTFTGAVGAGAVSCTISGTSPVADGTWDITFSDYEVRTCTLVTTGGVTAVSWDSTNPLINNVSAAGVIGGYDAEPSAIIIDYCTDVNHGANFNNVDTSQLQSHTWTSGGTTYYDNFKTYCVANGLYCSPWEDTQRAASDFLKDMCQITNSNAVMSVGQLKIVPYGDVVVTGNGVTYTPNLQPLFTFTDDDYVQAGATNINDPVTCVRMPLTETYNVVRVEFYDRGNAYNAALAEWTDPLDIAVNGIRVMSTITLHQITSAAVALKVAAMIGQRQLYVRNQYQFSVRNDQYMLLEPMDLISITDANLGVTDLLVRVISTEDDKDDTFTITCEDMLIGTATAPLYNDQAAQGFKANYANPPPSITTPVIFLAPPSLVGAGGGYEIWIAAGPASPTGTQTNDFGGCQVYASADDLTWTFVGSINGSARFGTLTSAITSITATTIYLTMNPETYALDYFLDSASAADFAANRALLYVDGEIMGFESVTLASAGQYTVSVSRGLFGTYATTHASGALWARLDQAIFKMPIDPGMIGQEIYFEFFSFNSVGHALQTSPADYNYTVSTTAGALLGVSSFLGSGVTIVGNEAYKSASTSAWDSSCYSQQGYTNGCSAECYVAQIPPANGIMFGLSRSPTTSNSYTNINYAWNFPSTGAPQIYESGTYIATFSTYAVDDFFQVIHDGKHVVYLHNGNIVRSVPDGNDTFYLQASFYDPNDTIYGIQFSPNSAAVTPYTLVPMSQNVACKGTTVVTNSQLSTPEWGARNFTSLESISGGASVSATFIATTGAQFIGFSIAPATGAAGGYGPVMAGIYLHGDSASTDALFNGSDYGSIGSTPVLGDVYSVTYDNFNFRWYINGAQVFQQFKPNLGPLYLFGDFYEGPLGFQNIAFEPYGTATPAQFIARGNMAVTDAYAFKLGGTGAWDSDLVSVNGYTTCNVHLKPNQTTGEMIFGLSSSIPASPESNEITYGIALNAGNVYQQTGATVSASLGSFAITDRFAVTYDGSTVTFLQNNQSIGTPVSIASQLFFAAALIYTPGDGFNSFDFGPGSTVPIIDTSGINANAVSQIGVASYYAESDVIGASTFETSPSSVTVVSYTITTSGAPIAIDGYVEAWPTMAFGPGKYQVSVQVGGTPIAIGGTFTSAELPEGYSSIIATTLIGSDSQSAGTYTYDLVLTAIGGTADYFIDVSTGNAYLKVREIKK